jgi:hypothetical protein
LSSVHEAFLRRSLFFALFLALFLVAMEIDLTTPLSSLSGYGSYGGYFSPIITGPATVMSAYKLVQLYWQYRKFRNTGYTYPYPKDV